MVKLIFKKFEFTRSINSWIKKSPTLMEDGELISKSSCIGISFRFGVSCAGREPDSALVCVER